MKNKIKRLQLIVRNYHKKGTIFGITFAVTLLGLSIAVPKFNIHAEEPGEPVFSITYNLNGATAGDKTTITEQSVCYGMELSEDNLITHLGVTVPAGKVLNYLTINDEAFNVGDGFFLDRNIIIKYFWRDDTTETRAVSFDANGGTVLEYAVPATVPLGQTYVFNAPDESQVRPPEGKEFDAFEINGTRYESGSVFTVTEDSSFKLLWRDPLPRTKSASTFKKTASSTEVVSWDTDLTDYINNKRIEWSNTAEGQGVDGDYREAWEALYVMNGDVYQYPVHLITYFTGVTIDETCGGTIQVGDPDSLVGGGCATYNYRVEYEEVSVVKPTFTVKFDTGSVLSGEDKIVDQTVTGGEIPDEPRNAAGASLFDLLGYCYESYGDDCYNNYRLEDFYTDPDYTIPYNGEPITQDTTIYVKWEDEYEGYERIKEINISVVPPEAGTEIVITDENKKWDSQSPQLEVTLLDGTKYHLWGEEGEYNYAYWLKGNTIDEYEPFAGVIEKGGKYYAEIWFQINEDALAIFDQELTLKINGVETPFEYTDYAPDGLALMIAVDIPTDEPISDVSAPESGAFTIDGSASSTALAISGTIAISVILSGLVVILFIRQRTKEE